MLGIDVLSPIGNFFHVRTEVCRLVAVGALAVSLYHSLR